MSAPSAAYATSPSGRERAAATARINGRTETWAGNSGQGRQTRQWLRAHNRPLYEELERRNQNSQANWHFFDCAEPNALGNLLAHNRGVDLSTIRISPTRRSHEQLPPCGNCDQWLERLGNGEFKIKDEILDLLPKPAAAAASYNLASTSEFPSL